MTDSALLLDIHSNGVATLTFNRPAKMNAFEEEMERDLPEALAGVATNPAVRVLVVTGAGRAFSAGGDVVEMRPGGAWQVPESQRIERFRRFHAICLTLHRFPKPTIAMVNGFAVGLGCNLCLACDLRISSESAKFGLAFVNVGLGDDFGGAWFLPRLVGTGKALELLLTGDTIDAAEAERIGMVNAVVPAEQLAAQTLALAERLARGAASAQALIKETVRLGLQASLEDVLDFEAEHQARQMESADHAEGIAAFLEKRDANFPR